MSRVGKLPIKIPAGVAVQQKGRAIEIKGPLGSETHVLPDNISTTLSEGTLVVTCESDQRNGRALHGLTRKLLANIVTGVSTGFTRTLEIVGVGYRAEAKGDAIHLALGYSHPIVYQLPKGVSAKIDKQTVLTLTGNSRHLLGEVCAQIRALRPPEPYKGKGIRYSDEHVRRKAGKAAGAGGR
jgi:large subunit ribosomal protein L6